MCNRNSLTEAVLHPLTQHAVSICLCSSFRIGFHEKSHCKAGLLPSHSLEKSFCLIFQRLDAHPRARMINPSPEIAIYRGET